MDFLFYCHCSIAHLLFHLFLLKVCFLIPQFKYSDVIYCNMGLLGSSIRQYVEVCKERQCRCGGGEISQGRMIGDRQQKYPTMHLPGMVLPVFDV